MHPQELQQLWTLLQEDENKVADLFVGADVKELKQEIEVRYVHGILPLTKYYKP